MNIQPFSLSMLWTIIIGSTGYFLVKLFIDLDYAIANMLIRSVLFTFFYGGLIYFFKLSEDINGLVDGLLKRLGLM